MTETVALVLGVVDADMLREALLVGLLVTLRDADVETEALDDTLTERDGVPETDELAVMLGVPDADAESEPVEDADSEMLPLLVPERDAVVLPVQEELTVLDADEVPVAEGESLADALLLAVAVSE